MDLSTIYTKDTNHLAVVACLLALPTSMFLWPVLIGGISESAVSISVYILPISLLSLYFLYRLYRSSRQKIILDAKGIQIDELSPNFIPWADIKSVKIVNQRLYRGPTAKWLVLNTSHDGQFQNKTLKKRNSLMFGGIPCCNLTTYLATPTAIEEEIKQRIVP